MRSRPLAAILLTLAFSACQLVWSYNDFKDQPSTGGSAPSSSSSSGGGGTAASSSSSSSGCTTDDDMDGFLSWTCDPTDITLDCADEDIRANPDAGFYPSPIIGERRPGTDPWDFDCDGQITQQTPVQVCGNYFLCAGGVGYPPGTNPVCGMAYPLGHCAPTGWFGACQWNAENPLNMRVQQCK